MNVKGQGNSIDVFEELWSEFEQRYAGFELRNIDWEKHYSTYRLKINEHTEPIKLFEVCCELLQELQDYLVSKEVRW